MSEDPGPTLTEDSTIEDLVWYAWHHSPRVEAAYQRWLAAAERLPQVSSLPDPRLSVGYFLDELETRTGPQQARIGIEQRFPWPGSLGDRKDAASRGANASWHHFERARLEVAERVVSVSHELVYLDAATRITTDNLELLRSFEQVVRARYRVGTGSHPELIRVQVELGQLEDRVEQLKALRPVHVARLNAAMHRDSGAEIPTPRGGVGRVVSVGALELASQARASNPSLRAMDEQIEEQRIKTDVARNNAKPDFSVGVDYLITGEATNPGTPQSGDDPVLLRFGVSLPLWREKYDAGVRESIARRLAIARDREDQADRLSAQIHQVWFEHTDADRRVRLYERTLIPKAEESLHASLAGFRAGETSFLDLLDTERTVLEFAVAAARARSDRGIALAQLNTLVGARVPTTRETDLSSQETQP